MSYMIVLEGLDAAGKATQAKRLVAKLDTMGRDAVVIAFPRYETVVGRAIRKLLVGEMGVMEQASPGTVLKCSAPEEPLLLQALFAMDKYDAAIDVEAHLDAGRIVICDRWTPSALCFGEADGVDATLLQRTQEHLPLADLNIFIDVPEEEALRRRPQMRDRFEKDRAKQNVVRANYETLWIAGADEEPEGWAKIDGVGTEEEVAARIWGKVAELLESE